jgi:hypothetical protein
MSRETTRRRLLAGGAAAALTSVAGCATTAFVGQRIEETERLSTDDVDAVAVETPTGSVTVRTAERDDIRVDIVKQSSAVTADVTELELGTERRDGRLRLFPQADGSESVFGGQPSMNLDLVVPSSLALEAVETSTGPVDVNGTSGDLDVTTTTGSIELRNVDGTVSASATTGAVEIEEVARLGDVDTSTGPVDVEVPRLDGDAEIAATTGSVTAALGSALDAELRVTTTTGDVTLEEVSLDDYRREDDRVTGTLGDGGPRLDIETTTGDVTLQRLT